MGARDNQLESIQAWMQQALMFSGDANSMDQTAAHIAPSQTMTPAQRLAIYQRGYYARLLQCLEGQFKALCHALGKALFDDFGREYLLQYPSASPTLALLGAQFPQFLRETRPDREAAEKEMWIDFIIDLAQFEWDLYTIFDAPGHEGKPYAGSLDPENALRLQPCLQLYSYDFPVSIYYSALAAGEDPDIPGHLEHHVAIVRKNFRTATYELLLPQFTFLKELMQGKCVEEALIDTALKYDKPEHAAKEAWLEWKKNWLEAGFFIPL